jgi:hypothetical protein
VAGGCTDAPILPNQPREPAGGEAKYDDQFTVVFQAIRTLMAPAVDGRALRKSFSAEYNRRISR